MEYSIEQAKSIFDLFKTITIYSLPLWFSLIFPVIWVTFKKLFGITNQGSDTSPIGSVVPENANSILVKKSESKVRKILNGLLTIIMLKGDRGDKFVFYTCVILFVTGSFTLKFGEYQEETIRQNAIRLRKYLQIQDGLNRSSEVLINSKVLTKKELDDILRDYPNKFIGLQGNIYNVDSSDNISYYKFIYPLIDSYLKKALRQDTLVNLDKLFQPKNNLRQLFLKDIVYAYIGLSENKNKYFLFTKKDTTFISINDSLKK